MNFCWSSCSPGTARSAIRWLARSFVTKAPPANRKLTSVPTTIAYQSIISCNRVVLRLTWCIVGLIRRSLLSDTPFSQAVFVDPIEVSQPFERCLHAIRLSLGLDAARCKPQPHASRREVRVAQQSGRIGQPEQ